MSLKTRSTQWSGVAMTWEIEALSTPTKAQGRELVTWARISPITPPWATTTTRWSTCAATMRSKAPRTRALNASAGSAPGITSQRCWANISSATGSRSATFWRKRPASQSPRCTSRKSASTCGVSPSRAARGAAVWTVRCRVLT